MGVVYKNQPSISQDLMSLRTLQQTCDERIMNISEVRKGLMSCDLMNINEV